MPVEAKPLCRPDVPQPHRANFHLPADIAAKREVLTRWAGLLWSPQAETLKEQELLPDFLTDVFCGILGYTRAVDNRDRYTFSREKSVEVDGKFADAVLGELTPATAGSSSRSKAKAPRTRSTAPLPAASCRPWVPATPAPDPFMIALTGRGVHSEPIGIISAR